MDPARVMVAVPCYGPQSARFSCALGRLLVALARAGALAGDAPVMTHGSYLDEARNALCRAALTTPDCTHVLFLDHDVVVPPLAAAMLLRHGKEVVGGWYRDKGREHRPTAFDWAGPGGYAIRRLTDRGQGLRQVGGVPMGCTLVRTQTLRHLGGRSGEWFRLGGPARYEDVHFCGLCREAGVPVWLDQDLVCGHAGEIVWDEESCRQAKG